MRTYLGEISSFNGTRLKETYRFYKVDQLLEIEDKSGQLRRFATMAQLSRYLQTRLEAPQEKTPFEELLESPDVSIRQIPVHRDAQTAFNEAIEAGRLSDNPESWNYAGNFMYMGTQGSKDLFKHRHTRRYIGQIPLKWEVFPDDRPAPHNYDGYDSIPGSICHENAACEDCGREVDNGGGCACACHSYV